MRNATTPLSPVQAATVERFYPRLSMRASTGDAVTLTYVKRDGSESSATGTVIGMVGNVSDSTCAVKVDTERGPRTINVWGITSME